MKGITLIKAERIYNVTYRDLIIMAFVLRVPRRFRIRVMGISGDTFNEGYK